MSISVIDVYEHDEIMCVVFSSEPKEEISQIYKNLASKANGQDSEGWQALTEHYDILFEDEQNKLFVREKNVSPGHYGTPSRLNGFPAYLLQNGHITPEEEESLTAEINASPPVVNRKNSHTRPTYLN